jgi:hypothetical protein
MTSATRLLSGLAAILRDGELGLPPGTALILVAVASATLGVDAALSDNLGSGKLSGSQVGILRRSRNRSSARRKRVEAVARGRAEQKVDNPGSHSRSDRSPFDVPPVTSFYPLEDSEKEAIQRVLRDHEVERQREASKHTSAA